jgi:hypothetical protein
MSESESFQDNVSESARKQLNQACRAKDKSVRLAWAITAGEAVLLGAVVVALADYWLMLPVWMRSTGAAVLALITLVGIARMVRFLRRPTRLKEVALDAESATPGLGCEVSTAAEYLSGERTIAREYEPELVAALEAKAAEHLGRATVPYSRRLRLPAIALSVTVLALIGFVAATPAGWRALTRTVLPFARVHYTELRLEPGNIEIAAGGDLGITNHFTGRAPKDPTFHWRHESDGPWQTAPLTTRASNGAYVYMLRTVRSDLEYQVTGGDAISEIYHVNAYVPPDIKELTVQIEYPDYTKLPTTTQKSPDISAVRASTARLQVEPTVKLSAASVHFPNSTEAIRLEAGADGSWSTNLKITRDTDYWIELVDTKGRRGQETPPHHIKALPDTPPKVEIEDPGQDMRAAATNSVPVKISVGDDFGVENVELVFHKLGGTDHVLQAAAQKGVDGETTAEAALDLAALDLHEFDVVAYQARARDNNNIDGPGKGESPVYFVEITNLEAGACRPKQPGQKLNLLALQKQIIADTAPLPTNAAPESFSALATRQRDAADFAEIYRSTLTSSGAPAEAVNELQTALQEMKTASAQLDTHKQPTALAAEENALAHLYQAIKHMPELKDMPTQPPPAAQPPSQNQQLAVVLEAIKEKKKQPAETNRVEDALQQAQRLAQAQAELNAALRQMASASDKGKASVPTPAQGQGQGQGKGKGQGEGQGQPSESKSDPAAGQEPKQYQGKAGLKDKQLASAQKSGNSQSKAKGKGKGKGKGQGKAKSQSPAQADAKGQGEGQGQGQGQGTGRGEPDATAKPDENQLAADSPQEETPASEKLANQEEELSKQADALAQKLARLAGKDQRLGHNAGQNANVAGHKIATAAQELKRGNFGAAGVNGLQGEAALAKVVTELQHIAREKPEWTDVANEEAPKQYEPLISEYFKQLSHAE